MTKIDLITGILGAGKTTFLRRIAEFCIRRGEKIAILENDFGAVNVDMMMLRDLQSDRCHLEMICGCCDPQSHRRRFRTQLISLGMQHFDRVIMEPSGIFDMDEFFDILYETPLDNWFSIGSILTVIDAGTDDTLPEEMEYLLGSEAAYAGKLIVSKLRDGIPLPEQAACTADRINRAMEQIRCARRFTAEDVLCKPWDALTDNDFAALTAASYRKADYVKQFRGEELCSGVHYYMNLQIPPEQIEPVLQSLFSDAECGKIRRIKGSLPGEHNTRLKINATAEAVEIAPVLQGQSVLIVIGEDLNHEAIDRHFRAVNTDPAYMSI